MSYYIDPVSTFVYLNEKIRDIETTKYDSIEDLRHDLTWTLDAVRDVLRELVSAHNESRS